MFSSRIDIINHIISKNNYKNYLEIGCGNDDCFNYINIANKIGIDPISGGTHRMTSDEFFKKNNYSFDIIFIDGLHTKPQFKRDVENSLKNMSPNGIIICHDINPTSEEMQQVPRMQEEWTGNIWEEWLEMRRTRGDLFMVVIDIDYGIGIIKKGHQKKLITGENINYQTFQSNKVQWLNLVDVNELNQLPI